MSLVTLGSAAYDTLDSPFGSRVRALGGAGVYASFAASFFTESRLIAVVGEDWNPEYSETLRSRGVDLAGLEIRSGEKTMSWHGRYPADMNRCDTLDIQLNVMDGYRPTAPEAWKNAPYLLLGNGAPEADMSLLDSMERPKLVVADTMNFYIDNAREALETLLRRIDGLILNDGEARQLTGVGSTLDAARKILEMGPRFVVVKRGEYGALWMSESELYLVPSYPTSKVVDPTGAGDSFAGAMMGVLAEAQDLIPASIKKALLYATVVASLNIEGFSLERFRNVRREEIEERVAKFRESLVY